MVVIARNEAISRYGNKDCFTLKEVRNDDYKKNVNGRNKEISRYGNIDCIIQ